MALASAAVPKLSLGECGSGERHRKACEGSDHDFAKHDIFLLEFLACQGGPLIMARPRTEVNRPLPVTGIAQGQRLVATVRTSSIFLVADSLERMRPRAYETRFVFDVSWVRRNVDNVNHLPQSTTRFADPADVVRSSILAVSLA